MRRSVLLVLALCSAPALADAEPSESAELAAARARFAEGLKLYDAGKYEEARVAFVQAYALKKHPTVLFDLAQASLKSGRPLEALRALEQWLKEAPDAPAAKRARAERGIAEAKRQLGRIEVIAPDGAEVTVDGRSAGRMPLDPIWVAPGSHTVKIATSEAETTESVTLEMAGSATVRLAKPATAKKIVATTAPPAPSDPGAAPEAPDLFSPPASLAPSYVAGAIGLAGFGAAAVLAGLRANAQTNAEDAMLAIERAGNSTLDCTRSPAAHIRRACTVLAEGNRDAQRYEAPLFVSLAIGSVGLASAFAWYFFAPKAAPDAALAPVLGPHTAGAAFRGRF